MMLEELKLMLLAVPLIVGSNQLSVELYFRGKFSYTSRVLYKFICTE
jgi:hypothetical protein